MFKRTLNQLINRIPPSNFPALANCQLRRFISASVENDKFVVVLQSNSQTESSSSSSLAPLKFPSVWLRDNCCCAQCFHPTSKSRKHDWDKFDVNVRVKQLQTNEQTKQLIIDWSDNHRSVYDLEWLQERAFIDARRQEYLHDFYRPKPKHWSGADFDKVTEIFDFHDVINTDEALKKWLEALAIYGVAIIRNSPIEKTVVRQLAERVGFIRRTTYGEEFIVQSKPGAKNVAYLSDPLPLHTDLPYYEYKPSCNILHCMVQSKSVGGSNLLVDAFHIADCMRADYPEDYKILTQTLVDWNDIGSEDDKHFHNIWRAPVICLDNDGNYTRINHSIPQRDSHFSVPLDAVIPWYEAYAKFVRLAREDAHSFKTKPGDVLTFNNIRLLHGRTGYDDTEENVRYIVGAYLDWDIIYSKLRVLKTQAGGF
ncbi:gamma-butyrobetaine dioxygenase [Stomoxys calcitrans]|uniref:gamma-butyrobetaine dioxygenase n=1 Tax=Stomoxys calcitrans TaxID=35570 RepID=UPI0027E2614B|nr:gamma-butyrobetaine dioxygenase [Stomoxys calcitrans]